MVKTHNCLVIINNGTKSDFTYVQDWYDSGRLADGSNWPATIKPSQQTTVKSYESDWAIMTGSSGYVTYKIFDTDITIAFSNPVVGTNKLGVGTGGKSVWDDMDNHSYHKFTVRIDSRDKKAILQFDCLCTEGSVNTCTVDVTAFVKQ